MTPEQQQALIDASAPLVENPTSWNDLPEEAKQLFLLLLPEPSFTEAQSYWIRFWWLPVTQETLEQLNALAPANTLLTGREDSDGNLWVSCDLLTDAFNDGRLAAMYPILATLPITYKTDWPQAEVEEE
jgi:hypothetical protein